MNAVHARVSKSGRISLPAELRKAVGLDRGGDVMVELKDNEIRIRTIDEVVSRAQDLTRQLLAGKQGASVAAFLADRRSDASEE